MKLGPGAALARERVRASSGAEARTGKANPCKGRDGKDQLCISPRYRGAKRRTPPRPHVARAGPASGGHRRRTQMKTDARAHALLLRCEWCKACDRAARLVEGSGARGHGPGGRHALRRGRPAGRLTGPPGARGRADRAFQGSRRDGARASVRGPSSGAMAASTGPEPARGVGAAARRAASSWPCMRAECRTRGLAHPGRSGLQEDAAEARRLLHLAGQTA